jgi:hypothetical protein
VRKEKFLKEKINILVVEPGKSPYLASVEDTLEAFSKIVGGPIEVGCSLPHRVMLLCNSEGKHLGLPPNRTHPNGQDYIAGTFFLCGYEDDHFSSLPAAQQEMFQAFFRKPGEFMMVGTDTMCGSLRGLTEAVRKLWDRMKDNESVILTKYGGPEEGAPV